MVVTAAAIVTGGLVGAVDVVVGDVVAAGTANLEIVIVVVDGCTTGAASCSISGAGGFGGVVVTVVEVVAGGASGAGSLTISSANAETKPLERQARSMSRLATRARRPLEVGITGLRVAVS
ncbi:MAG TPA: hypothetical protein VJS45_03845, partial [Acidimicrobiia bacterium]|nr:hypothetical protein [Acidimicrobiia bacterium]